MVIGSSVITGVLNPGLAGNAMADVGFVEFVGFVGHSALAQRSQPPHPAAAAATLANKAAVDGS